MKENKEKIKWEASYTFNALLFTLAEQKHSQRKRKCLVLDKLFFFSKIRNMITMLISSIDEIVLFQRWKVEGEKNEGLAVFFVQNVLQKVL